MIAPNLQLLVNASLAPEVRLPDAAPLTLTRNFAWVFLFCVGSLITFPLAIAWTAAAFLK